jgi:hypothetical protein
VQGEHVHHQRRHGLPKREREREERDHAHAIVPRVLSAHPIAPVVVGGGWWRMTGHRSQAEVRTSRPRPDTN